MKEETLYAQVIVDVSHGRLDRIFEYALPAEMTDRVTIGHRVLIPFGSGNKETEGFVLGLSSLCSYDPAKVTRLLRTLDEENALLPEQVALARWMADRYNCLLVEALRLMIPAEMRGGRVREKRAQTARLLLEGAAVEEAKQSLMSKEGKVKAPTQWELLSLLLEGSMDVSLLDRRLPGARSALRSMEKKGWVSVTDRENLRKPYEQMETEIRLSPVMTGEQQAAIDQLNAAQDAGVGDYVLKGVTGSGKTEVYLHAIKHCIESGKDAIMLVPEISLTPQTVDRFRSRFGDGVAVLHSRLSAGERFDEWRRVSRGEADIVLGARSAVFMPLANIGVIMIDEAHAESYKAENNPVYHAAKVANRRANMNEAVLV